VPEIAWVNGHFLPLEHAMVHIEDRGFQYADSVYEEFRTYSGRLFAAEEHLARLERSLAAVALTPGHSRDQLRALLEEAVRRAAFPESVVYLQLSRGRAPRHRRFPTDGTPTLVITVRAGQPAGQALARAPVKLTTVPDERWARCDIKSVALLANVLAYQAAHAAGADDAVFVSADGLVAESTAGNVFVVGAGRLRTPPKNARILAGVTRDKMIAAATAAGLSCGEEPVHRQELWEADEVFLTSTTAELVAVACVDGRMIGPTAPGPVTARVYDAYCRQVLPGQPG